MARARGASRPSLPLYWLLAFITTNLSILSFNSSPGGSSATSCCFSALASNVHQPTSIAAATCTQLVVISSTLTNSWSSYIYIHTRIQTSNRRWEFILCGIFAVMALISSRVMRFLTLISFGAVLLVALFAPAVTAATGYPVGAPIGAPVGAPWASTHAPAPAPGPRSWYKHAPAPAPIRVRPYRRYGAPAPSPW